MDGTGVLWSDIATAQPGSADQNRIDAWALQVKAWAIPIEFTFNHQPETVSNLSRGADAYNWYQCRAGINNAWKPLAAIIENFRLFGASHPSKRLWLPEWASTEDPASPDRKAQWIADAQALFKQPGYEQFDGIVYFDHINPAFADCNEPPESTSQSVTAFRTMGADPFYGAGLPGPK